jgi:hypothetical protein
MPCTYRAGGIAAAWTDLERPEAPAHDRHQVRERAAGVDADEGQVVDFALEPVRRLASAFASALPLSDLALSLLPRSALLSDAPEPRVVLLAARRCPCARSR